MNGSGPGVVHQLTGVVVMATTNPGAMPHPYKIHTYSSPTPQSFRPPLPHAISFPLAFSSILIALSLSILTWIHYF